MTARKPAAILLVSVNNYYFGGLEMDYKYALSVGRFFFWLFVVAVGVALYIAAPEVATALVDQVLMKAASWVQF